MGSEQIRAALPALDSTGDSAQQLRYALHALELIARGRPDAAKLAGLTVKHITAGGVAPVPGPELPASVTPEVRDAERALNSIRRVIDQDTARDGEKATLALFLDDDVATLQQFVSTSGASLRDAGRYREVRQHAYRYGVGHPTPEQLDAQVDARISAGGAGSQVEASSKARTGVIMPRNISEKLLLVAATALRAGLCEMTGSDGHVVKKVFHSMYSHLAETDHEGPALGTAEHVLLPAELDDDLWRAGIEAFRKAMNLKTGLDMFTAKQTYEGLYAHLAARAATNK
jgi:hypothetical protein